LSPELFECVMNSNQLSIVNSLSNEIEYRRLDIGEFPKHRDINNEFCMIAFKHLIGGMRIGESSYNGLAKHWTSSDGTSLSAAALTSTGTRQLLINTKSHLNAFKKYLSGMLELTSDMSEIKYNNCFTMFYKSGVNVFEGMYIKPNSRIFANKVMANNYFIYGLLAMEGSYVMGRIKEHPEHAASKGMFDAIYYCLSSNKRSHGLAKSVLQVLFDNKETRHIFALMDKKMHDLLVPNIDASDEALRSVGWKDNAIKRDYIILDMGI
jgi:hypothetical protein